MPWFNPFKKKPIVQMTHAAGKPQLRQEPKNRFKKSAISSTQKDNFARYSSHINVSKETLIDRSKFLQTYFDALVRYWPLVSDAVWIWTHLVSTPQTVDFIGGENEDRAKAKTIIDNLDKKLYPFDFVKGAGSDALMDLYFTSVFTWGRFAGIMKLSPEMNSIEDLLIVDPFKINFLKENDKIIAALETSPTEAIEVNPATFFYYGLNMTQSNPYGHSMLEAAPTLIEIADELLMDMRFSSRNAGLPRLHFKIAQPPIMDNELPEDYQKRMNDYFNSTVNELAEIGPDDNFYTWNDVEIKIAGGHLTTAFVWKQNRQVVEEEIITAFHLYPWLLGKTPSTSKNWTRTQFDIIMTQAASIQKAASGFLNWLRNTELALRGLSQVKAFTVFSKPHDPSAKDMAIAESFRIKNATTKVRQGYTSPDDAARELGFQRAFDPTRIYAQQKIKETPPKEASDDGSPINKESEDVGHT